MTIAALVVAGLAILIAVAALARTRTGPPLSGKTVIVHTRDSKTLRGILHGTYTDRVTLRDASLIERGGIENALGGLEHVPTANISFIQQIEAK